MADFLDHHAERAADLGWTEGDLFGVHPESGAVRGDCSGALTGGWAVTEVHADRLALGHLSYRRHPCPGPRIPIWAFSAASGNSEEQ